MTKQTFIRGTFMLIIAGMITRFLGFINRIILARLMGEEGVGLYMMALPSLFLVVTLTQIGLPIAISKRVAEANATKQTYKIKQIITISILIIACTSIFFTICLFFSAPFIAHYLLTDERSLYPIMAVSFVIPLIAISSIIKGYFQGMKNMKPQSYSIVIEQIVRISIVYFLIKLLLPYGIEFAATGAIVSIVFGELASCIYLLIIFKRNKIVPVRKRFFSFLNDSKKTRRQLMSIALPNTGSRLISSFSNFLEPIIVSQSLALAGYSKQESTRQYGELTGYAMPLLFLPTFITNSLSIALIPFISEAIAYKDEQLVHNRIHQAIRISFASGALATIVLSLFSIPILTYIYDTSNASRYIIFMAPFFLLLYVQAPLQSALYGLDLAKQAMWNSFIGSTVKFIVLFLLASNASIGMMGVAVAICISVVLVTCLHLAVLYKYIQFTLRISDLIKMITLLTLTTLSGYGLKYLFNFHENNLLSFMLVLVILSFIYIGLLIILRFITKTELKQVPVFNYFIK